MQPPTEKADSPVADNTMNDDDTNTSAATADAATAAAPSAMLSLKERLALRKAALASQPAAAADGDVTVKF